MEQDLMMYLDPVRKLYRKYHSKIVLPVDVGMEIGNKRADVSVRKLPSNNMIWDIGPGTVSLFAEHILNAKMLVMKGTPGNYLKKGFDVGTRNVLRAVADSDCFSLLGGGDTSTSVNMFGINKNRISYVSLAGGAFIEFMSGKKLPGVQALKS